MEETIFGMRVKNIRLKLDDLTTCERGAFDIIYIFKVSKKNLSQAHKSRKVQHVRIYVAREKRNW